MRYTSSHCSGDSGPVTEEGGCTLWMSSDDAVRRLRQLWLSCGRVNITCAFVSKFILFIYFWLCHTACRILVPWPGIKPMPPTMEAWIHNHRTARVCPNITWFFYYVWPATSQGWSLWRGISLCGMPLGCLLECMQTTDHGFHNNQFKVTKVCHPSGEGSEEQ